MEFRFLTVVITFLLLVQNNTTNAREDGPSTFNFDCSGKRDGNYPHPTKCTHYVSCSGKRAYEVECAKGLDGNPLYYVRDSGPDPQSSKCDSPDVVDRDGSCNSRGGPILLDWNNNPEHVIHITKDNVEKRLIRTTNPSKFKFSIQLAKMKARTCGSTTDHPSIGLVQLPGRFDYFCTDFDNLGGNFKYVQHTYYNYGGVVEVEAAGTWGPTDEAILVATIYQDVNSCSDCPSGSFCCEGGSSCEGASTESRKVNISQSVAPDSTRCIPNQLQCNKRPNCGKVCNADEKVEDCGEYGGAFSVRIGIISILLGFIAVLSFNL